MSNDTISTTGDVSISFFDIAQQIVSAFYLRVLEVPFTLRYKNLTITFNTKQPR